MKIERNNLSKNRRVRVSLILMALGCIASVPAVCAADMSVQSAAASPFRFTKIDDQSLGLWQGDQPVFIYNHGVIRKAGVPADRARSTYLHPLYGLDGEVLTDDFPRDHYHHRGLFWAWPHVKIDGREYDLWMLKGIQHQFERWLNQRAEPDAAVLGVQNGWYVGDRKVMDEQVWIKAHPAKDNQRAIDFEFVWTPKDRPVTLTGAEGKSYGGLTLRYAPGTNTVITIPTGPTLKDLPMTNLPWADLTRRWTATQQTSGAAMFVHPSHPDFPPQWLTRHYGVLCLGWPGVSAKSFPPGEAIRCRYRIWIHRGNVPAAELAKAFEAYSTTPPAIPNRTEK